MITREDYAWKRLGAAIVLQAVRDWQLLCKQGKKYMTRNEYPVSLTEIRQFLKSEYALRICIGIEPSEILRKLEEEHNENKIDKR